MLKLRAARSAPERDYPPARTFSPRVIPESGSRRELRTLVPQFVELYLDV